MYRTFKSQFRYYGQKQSKKKRKKKKAPPVSRPLEDCSSDESIPIDFSRSRFEGERCRSRLNELSLHYEKGYGNPLPQRSYDDIPSGEVYSTQDDLNSFLEPLRKYEDRPDVDLDKFYTEIVEDLVSDEVFLPKELYPMTPPQEKRIKNVLRNGSGHDILFDMYNVKMSRAKMRCLRDGVWLNDEVMNFYVNLIRDRNERTHPNFPNPVKRKKSKAMFTQRNNGQLPEPPKPMRKTKANSIPNCFMFTTFFYFKLCQQKPYNHRNVHRWTRFTDLFLYDKVIVPVHLGNHWVCGVINFRDRRFEYYDSLYSYRNGINVLNNLKRYMEDEYYDKKKMRTNMFDDFDFYLPSNIPQQRNGFDCGVFALKFASFVAQDLPFTFSQNHMRFFRKKIGSEILNCMLM